MRQVQIRHLFVAADVQRPDDQPPSSQHFGHFAIDLVLFFLVWGMAAF